jgi:asparagine synthase (glutamine-hydrolysing)
MTVCIWTPEEVEKLTGYAVPLSGYDDEFVKYGHASDLSRMMRVDLRTYLPDAMLTKVDRASMASGLEVRVPLLDHRVVEYAMGLPDNLKYRNGSGKYLLKKLLEKYLPSALFNRPKMGFGVPIGDWFRNELKGMLCDYLSPSRLKRTGWLNPDYVYQKIDEHMSGRVNHQYRLWSLLVWEMWAERWLNNG